MENTDCKAAELANSHKNVCEKLHDIYVKKNHDYGDSFGNLYRKRGPITSVIHIEEKFNRFEELTVRGKKPKVGESIIDTLMDLANYAILTIMEIEKESVEGEQQ